MPMVNSLPTRLQFARNVLLNWVAMFAGMVVPFFLSPFTVHHLGNVMYGVWVLVVSSVAYFHLLDLGLRSAITTFVSKSHALGRHEESQRVVSTAVWIRIGISAVILLLAAVIAILFPHVFTLPTKLWIAVRMAILLTTVSIAFTLASGVPGAVLAALHRYDLLSLANLLRTLFRAGGFVILLQRGKGIVALAAWEVAVAVLTCALMTALCSRVFSGLKDAFRRPERSMVRKLWSYSAYAFLVTIAGAIVNYLDNGVVGIFLSPVAVTFYAIAGNLILYSREAIAAMSNTFVPVASGFKAGGKTEQLQRLLFRGTQASLLLSLPISIVLFVRGRTFIGLWMGPEYAEISGTLLQILLLNQILTVANLTSSGIAYGMEKHRPLAMWALIEAFCNLSLSVLLVRKMGLVGVAWGTSIAGLICNLLFWPRYISRLLEIPATEYVSRAWLLTALSSVPFVIACVYVERSWRAGNLVEFFLQTAAILPVYLISIAFVFRKEFLAYMPARLQATFGVN
jgi:O-antigen/teichoic acid export membrane protein